MIRKTYRIVNPHGLHARPAAAFVKAVGQVPWAIELTFGDRTVNAKSILQVLSVGGQPEDQITMTYHTDNIADIVAVEAQLTHIMTE